MKRAILVDVESFMSGVALTEEGALTELHIEYKTGNRLTGNIYKGKVESVLSGLESAFVNIGLGRNGFLNVGETLDDRADLRKVIPGALNVHPGDYLMVQVTKEQTGQKGARLTANISLPGRYVVFLPKIDFVGISNKITDPDRRTMLTKLLEKYKPTGGGLIARTVCIDADKKDIVAEIKRMQALYDRIRRDYEQADGVCLLHSEDDLILRAIRDMLSGEVERIVCNDAATVQKIKERLRSMESEFYRKVELYDGVYDIWDAYDITPQVDKLLDRRVMLPSGGSLCIDRTEALTAIDVNSGGFYAGADHEETVYLTNMEAATEIARQLRLRNIGGIIVVDFIDMASEEHRAEVVNALRREVLRDRIKTRVLDMTGLGLVEMTRKKVGNELSTKLLEPCRHCKGSSYAPSTYYIARKLRAALRRTFADTGCANAIVRINDAVLENIIGKEYFSDLCEGEWKDRRIYLVPDERCKPLGFEVAPNDDASIDLPNGAKLLY